MSELDFITALGRLLRDGRLRDAFCADPAVVLDRLGVETGARTMLLRIAPADLEFQARILLRKRFALLARQIPGTLAGLRDRGWHLFQQYGRACWPEEGGDIHDARQFCHYCRGIDPETVVQCELNRLEFELGTGRFALHYVRNAQIRNRPRPGLQLLFRTRTGRPHQLILYAGL